MLSKELINFINAQEPTESIHNISESIGLLIESLTDFKKELSENLPRLYMEKNKKAVDECFQYGEEIDEFILGLNSLNITSIKRSKAHSQGQLNISDVSVLKPIKLVVIEDTVCPKCNVKLSDTKTSYTTFCDKDKTQIKNRSSTSSYKCPECHRYFVKKDILSAINISETNIEPIYFSTDTKTQNTEVAAKKCVQCGDPVWNNTSYCWEHYKYHNSESK